MGCALAPCIDSSSSSQEISSSRKGKSKAVTEKRSETSESRVIVNSAKVTTIVAAASEPNAAILWPHIASLKPNPASSPHPLPPACFLAQLLEEFSRFALTGSVGIAECSTGSIITREGPLIGGTAPNHSASPSSLILVSNVLENLLSCFPLDYDHIIVGRSRQHLPPSNPLQDIADEMSHHGDDMYSVHVPDDSHSYTTTHSTSFVTLSVLAEYSLCELQAYLSKGTTLLLHGLLRQHASPRHHQHPHTRGNSVRVDSDAATGDSQPKLPRRPAAGSTLHIGQSAWLSTSPISLLRSTESVRVLMIIPATEISDNILLTNNRKSACGSTVVRSLRASSPARELSHTPRMSSHSGSRGESPIPFHSAPSCDTLDNLGSMQCSSGTFHLAATTASQDSGKSPLAKNKNSMFVNDQVASEQLLHSRLDKWINAHVKKRKSFDVQNQPTFHVEVTSARWRDLQDEGLGDIDALHGPRAFGYRCPEPSAEETAERILRGIASARLNGLVPSKAEKSARIACLRYPQQSNTSISSALLHQSLPLSSVFIKPGGSPLPSVDPSPSHSTRSVDDVELVVFPILASMKLASDSVAGFSCRQMSVPSTAGLSSAALSNEDWSIHNIPAAAQSDISIVTTKASHESGELGLPPRAQPAVRTGETTPERKSASPSHFAVVGLAAQPALLSCIYLRHHLNDETRSQSQGDEEEEMQTYAMAHASSQSLISREMMEFAVRASSGKSLVPSILSSQRFTLETVAPLCATRRQAPIHTMVLPTHIDVPTNGLELLLSFSGFVSAPAVDLLTRELGQSRGSISVAADVSDDSMSECDVHEQPVVVQNETCASLHSDGGRPTTFTANNKRYTSKSSHQLWKEQTLFQWLIVQYRVNQAPECVSE